MYAGGLSKLATMISLRSEVTADTSSPLTMTPIHPDAGWRLARLFSSVLVYGSMLLETKDYSISFSYDLHVIAVPP